MKKGDVFQNKKTGKIVEINDIRSNLVIYRELDWEEALGSEIKQFLSDYTSAKVKVTMSPDRTLKLETGKGFHNFSAAMEDAYKKYDRIFGAP